VFLQNPLLSICIPTFNRADYLKNTLNSITGQEKFSESCEVIISDNNSTDNTRDIGEYFAEKFENVRYYCNKTNIGADRNFLNLLNYGQGKYLKLHSDKSCFYEDKLNELVEYIEKVDHSVIFLLNENTKHKNKGICECNNFDEFVQIASFWSTWMCGIILRNKEYKNLKNKDRAIGSNLIQTDIMFRILENCSSSLIINEKLLHEQEVESKGGYNLFEVFVCNYLTLYQDYLQKGTLSRKTYNKEKTKLLEHFIFPWYTTNILIMDKKYRFDVSKANRTIIKHYWNKPQLLLYPLYLLGKGFFRITALSGIFLKKKFSKILSEVISKTCTK
jgi:abequosyltransferase